MIKLKQLWGDLKIAEKLMLSFGLILSFCVIIFLILFLTSRKVDEFTKYKDRLTKAQVEIGLLIIDADNFMINDLTDTAFFEKGGSSNTKLFSGRLVDVEILLSDLRDNSISKSEGFSGKFSLLQNEVSYLEKTFEELYYRCITKGFYNYGLIGELRDAIHLIEDYHSEQIGLSNLLVLRRHEKDYLLRKQYKYVELFRTKIEEIDEDMSDNGFDEVSKLLKHYQNAFNKVVIIENEINNPQTGLKSNLNTSLNLISIQINELVYLANDRVQDLNSKVNFWVILLVLIMFAIMVILALYLAKQISKPVVVLNNVINDFVTSGFVSRYSSANRFRKDEIGLLNRNFIEMQKEIAESFAEYRTKAMDKQRMLEMKNEKIEIQKYLLKEHRSMLRSRNEEINDSLNYASSMQKLFMPSDEQLKTAFPNSEIWIQAKDKVSGDFYWMHFENESIRYLALADCTGHGVPGAMLSVLGVNFLNAAVIDSKLTDVTEILDYVDLKIKFMFSCGSEVDESFAQSMDITILKVDLLANLVEVASGNRDYVIQQNGELLREKISKSSVGSFVDMPGEIVRFPKRSYSLDSLEKVYLYSDGILDQFGTESSKKFKFKRFIQTISEHDEVAKAVKEVKSSVLAWKGGNDQTDDISLIGIDCSQLVSKNLSNVVDEQPNKMISGYSIDPLGSDKSISTYL